MRISSMKPANAAPPPTTSDEDANVRVSVPTVNEPTAAPSRHSVTAVDASSAPMANVTAQ